MMTDHELRRRQRVVGQFWWCTEDAAERRYLKGGPVPKHLVHIDRVIR